MEKPKISMISGGSEVSLKNIKKKRFRAFELFSITKILYEGKRYNGGLILFILRMSYVGCRKYLLQLATTPNQVN